MGRVRAYCEQKDNTCWMILEISNQRKFVFSEWIPIIQKDFCAGNAELVYCPTAMPTALLRLRSSGAQGSSRGGWRANAQPMGGDGL